MEQMSAQINWIMPGPGGILTFLIRIFFVIVGLAALFQLLMGALGVIISGGKKEGTEAAYRRMGSALIGVVLVIVVISGITVLEKQVFKCAICFGIACPLHIPSLIEPGPPPATC